MSSVTDEIQQIQLRILEEKQRLLTESEVILRRY